MKRGTVSWGNLKSEKTVKTAGFLVVFIMEEKGFRIFYRA
jgi:hypothetical protein